MAEKLLCGVEIEWFNAHFATRPANVENLVESVLAVLKRQGSHLSDGGRGVFLADGSRVYYDCGHVEFASCEAADPLTLVTHVKAFERLLQGVAPQAAEDLGGGQVVFARLNVDHLSESTSYAQHESYLTRHPPAFFARGLIPHLVTRVAYCGEGGPASSGGALSVSPRMFHFASETDHQTLHNRPIFNLRDESLAGPGHFRLHVICGATLASELAFYLKVGITSLVVRTIELGGENIADHLRLAEPVIALHQVAADLSCKEPLRLADGRRLTAVAIQREYLSLVRRYLTQLPEWAPAVCDRLESVLEALANDPRLMSTTLDWAIKHAIFSDQRPESKDEGSDILAALYLAVRRTAFGQRRPDLEVLLGPSSPILGTVASLNEQLRRRNLQWQDLKPQDSARMRMAEIDTRFGILGEGIFDQLDRQGFLNHKLVTDEHIERAKSVPPPDTRARLRGLAAERFTGKSGMVCTWQGVYDYHSKKVLDLRNPWQQEEHWMPTEAFERGLVPDEFQDSLFESLERFS